MGANLASAIVHLVINVRTADLTFVASHRVAPDGIVSQTLSNLKWARTHSWSLQARSVKTRSTNYGCQPGVRQPGDA
eukprot:1193484-Prorocentrum_minimum.AAC.7